MSMFLNAEEIAELTGRIDFMQPAALSQPL